MYTAFTYILIIITNNSTTNIGLILILSDALVGMHVSKSVCMYVCMHSFMCLCMCVHVCMYVCMYICTYVCMYMHFYMCMRMHTTQEIQCVHVYNTSVSTHIYICYNNCNIYTYIYSSLSLYIYTCKCTFCIANNHWPLCNTLHQAASSNYLPAP